MSFKVVVKNFGKLTDATIRIGKFTVFAGPNNTGKSFVSKALYSIFIAMNANHLAVVLDSYLAKIQFALRKLSKISEDAYKTIEYADKVPEFVEKISEGAHFKTMYGMVADLRREINNMSLGNDVDDLDIIEEKWPYIRDSLAKIRDSLPESKVLANLFLGSLQKAELDGAYAEIATQDSEVFRRNMERMEKWITRLDKEVIGRGIAELVGDGFAREAHENLIHNFQVDLLSDLVGGGDGDANFNVADIGGIQISKTDRMDWKIFWGGMRQVQKYSKVLYLESPVFWKSKNALEYMRPRMRDSIGGIPQYVYDMFDTLRLSYPAGEDVIDRDVLDKLTGSMGGKVAIGETGDLFFQDSAGGIYPLPLAATGIANLGMLALLIEKNLLDKNTFLFIDEPEAHLHPAWQVEMAEALFALAEGGVNIVIATHSADILKWLEVKLKESPESGELVALNHFGADGVKSNGGDVHEKLDAIQEELAHPYAKLYYRGI